MCTDCIIYTLLYNIFLHHEAETYKDDKRKNVSRKNTIINETEFFKFGKVFSRLSIVEERNRLLGLRYNVYMRICDRIDTQVSIYYGYGNTSCFLFFSEHYPVNIIFMKAMGLAPWLRDCKESGT